MIHNVTRWIQRPFRWCFITLGGLLSRQQLMFVQRCYDYIELGRWLRTNHHQVDLFNTSRDRNDVFAVVAQQVSDKKVLYLEFGVFEGASMRYWSKALQHPDAQLHGFDSFAGLPDSWDFYYDKGHFDTGGKMPDISDPRVRFFKGWFDQTLPSYVPPAHDVLVINIDADLYTSTAYVLKSIANMIKPGTFIYFDEFSFAKLQELHAFDEFIKEHDRRFEMIAHSESLSSVFFKCVG